MDRIAGAAAAEAEDEAAAAKKEGEANAAKEKKAKEANDPEVHPFDEAKDVLPPAAAAEADAGKKDGEGKTGEGKAAAAEGEAGAAAVAAEEPATAERVSMSAENMVEMLWQDWQRRVPEGLSDAEHAVVMAAHAEMCRLLNPEDSSESDDDG